MVVRNVTVRIVPANYYGMLVVWREELANAMVHQARARRHQRKDEERKDRIALGVRHRELGHGARPRPSSRRHSGDRQRRQELRAK